MSGPIPPELVDLADTLTSIQLNGNSGLTGCVPYALRGVSFNDFAALDLPFCPPRATLVPSPSSITEDGDTATVTATLDAAPGAEVTLTVSAAPVAPAVAGDFTLSGTTLTIAADSTTSTGDVIITAADNDTPNPDRTVTVSAVLPDGFMLPGNTILANPEDVTLDPGVAGRGASLGPCGQPPRRLGDLARKVVKYPG